VLWTRSPVDHGHHLASWMWYIAGSKRRCWLQEKMTKCLRQEASTLRQRQQNSAFNCSVRNLTIKDSTRRFVILKLTTDRHEASRGLFATAELLVHWDMAIYRFSKWRPSAILELFYHHTRPPTKSLLLAAAAWNFMSIWYRQFYLNTCCELKQPFLHVWYSIDQTIIDNAVDEWRGRLRACVQAKGWHFEQLLWQYLAIWQETFQFLSMWHDF